MEKIEYNNILLDIIKRNGGSRKWPNLYIVEIDERWDPLTDDMADWVKVDYRYPIYLNGTEEHGFRERQYAEPSYLAFYMDSVEIGIDHDADPPYLRHLKKYRPHIAFQGDQGVLKIQAMCCGDEFDCYPFVISSKMMDRYEDELKEIIKSICPCSLTMRIEDNTEFERQFCNLLDVIFGYTTVQRLISGSEKDLSFYAFDYVFCSDDENINDVDDLINSLHGSFYYEYTGNWRYFDYQHLCLLCIHAAINDLLCNESMYYESVLQIMKDKKIILDVFTQWYLKNNESSIKEEDIRIAKEIINLCEET